MSELGWPVGQGGTAVVSASGTACSWRPGTGPDDEFPVASVTKLLTTLATLAAVEGGHLGLDDPASIAGQPVEGAAEAGGITVRHLLAHASGLPAGLVDHPGGRAVTTLPDLARLARCLLDRGAPVVGPELFAEATSVQFPGLAGVVPGVGRFDPNDWGLGFELHDGKHPHWMGARRSPAAFGHFGGSGCFLWVDPRVEVAAAAVTDRPVDDGWIMDVWPAWSDRLPAA